IENACGVEATGDRVTDSSWLAVKQEIFGATQGISLHTRNGLLGEDVKVRSDLSTATRRLSRTRLDRRDRFA
ncbi:transposase, partial [Geitlerinema sp. CS-897]|nr:transposase [Geitlerinema sp. CS-897]